MPYMNKLPAMMNPAAFVFYLAFLGFEIQKVQVKCQVPLYFCNWKVGFYGRHAAFYAVGDGQENGAFSQCAAAQ